MATSLALGQADADTVRDFVEPLKAWRGCKREGRQTDAVLAL